MKTAEREKIVSETVEEVNRLVQELEPKERMKAYDPVLRLMLRQRLGRPEPMSWEKISPDSDPMDHQWGESPLAQRRAG